MEDASALLLYRLERSEIQEVLGSLVLYCTELRRDAPERALCAFPFYHFFSFG